jgi:hypothetical protein
MKKLWVAVGVAVAAAAAVAGQACTSSSSGPSQTEISNACMHICGCETGTPDLTYCQGHCTMGSGSAVYSSFSSSISVSFSLSHASEACVTCINSAACADLESGVACTTECQ